MVGHDRDLEPIGIVDHALVGPGHRARQIGKYHQGHGGRRRRSGLVGGVIRRRMEQGAGHFMPAALLDSQISLSERPAVYERPIVDDEASAPDAIVNAVTARLGQ